MGTNHTNTAVSVTCGRWGSKFNFLGLDLFICRILGAGRMEKIVFKVLSGFMSLQI